MTDEPESEKLMPVTHMEAHDAAQRLINSHFRQEPGARVSIPARPDYDDDLRIMRYIEEQAARAPSPGEDDLRAALREWLRLDGQTVRDHRECVAIRAETERLLSQPPRPAEQAAPCVYCGFSKGDHGHLNPAHTERGCSFYAAAPAPSAAPGGKLWLWKNFVDGRPEYWAFDNPFPTIDGGDPMTLGEPCGYALFKPSTNGRPDVSDETVIADIRAAKE